MKSAPVPPVDDLRKVIHIDMDAFFASVEQRDNPDLRGRPVAVGGPDRRSVVAAASYEAREFGVRSAMPSFKARELCKHLVFVPPRFDVYRSVSMEIREIFLSYTPLVEPMSLDEAYLDVTATLRDGLTATKTAKEIRAKIFEKTGLTASAGVSCNKFLAKLASDQMKPNGMFVITPDQGAEFVADLPVGKFHGIGPVTAARMNSMGIETGRHLRERELDLLCRNFGKAGEYFYWISRGVDRRPVDPDRERKSAGAENTFDQNLSEPDELRAALTPIVRKAWERCERSGSRGRTVVLKVKYSDFTQITRSRSLPGPVKDLREFEEMAVGLLNQALPMPLPVRLLGVSLSGLGAEEPENSQLSLI